MKETYYFVNKIIKNKILAGIVSFFVFFILIGFMVKLIEDKKPELLSFKGKMIIATFRFISLLIGILCIYFVVKLHLDVINYHPK